jgi:hypothetical protein
MVKEIVIRKDALNQIRGMEDVVQIPIRVGAMLLKASDLVVDSIS